MFNGRQRNRVCSCALLLLCVSTALATASCSSSESKVKKMLQVAMKAHGVTDVVVDYFYTDPNFPDKAYTSATVTYNFATAEGKPQREYLGFILAKAGDDWKIERNTGYTKEQQQAVKFLAGGK